MNMHAALFYFMQCSNTNLYSNFLLYYRILFRTLNHQYDYTFDWTMLKQKSNQAGSSSQAAIQGTAEKRDEREREGRNGRDKNETVHTASELK